MIVGVGGKGALDVFLLRQLHDDDETLYSWRGLLMSFV